MAANQRWRHMASCFTQEHFKDVDTPAYKTMTGSALTNKDGEPYFRMDLKDPLHYSAVASSVI